MASEPALFVVYMKEEIIVNQRIEQLALDAGLLNYVDNETPKRYFIDGHADLDEVQKFAELIVRECARVSFDQWCESGEEESAENAILKHFGF